MSTVIAGFDTSFTSTKSIAAIVILEYPSFKVLYQNYLVYEQSMEYKAGFLGQKECPKYFSLLNSSPIKPDIIFVDGFGLLHPEKYGSATRLGTTVEIPTIGVAKNLMETVVSVSRDDLKSSQENMVYLPSSSTNEILGVAWRNPPKFSKYIYISIGWGLLLEECIDWTRKCCIHRIPEPIRLADLYSRSIAREIEA
ncbi:Endonuclease V domain-containing protein [Rozella allomycis CSF55]|uniref:Endonuclease V domain-containing protein n=1 Tax=Rozella allomycis (strain CSF55) TaxID=988480 RepID=A0A075B441_ROZAC|nr:Endonuclease V domain-containing protein [Rozella allomycis CSF55]|eukprot:EPZ35844.1 Endonuclease V domain-containing protein [Rozella allomycis CSF55]